MSSSHFSPHIQGLTEAYIESVRATPTKLFYITWNTHYRFRVVATTCVRDDLRSGIFDAAHRHGIDAVAVNVQPHHAHAFDRPANMTLGRRNMLRAASIAQSGAHSLEGQAH